MLVGGGAWQPRHFGGLLDRQSHDVAKLDQFGSLRILAGQPLESLVKGQEFVRRRGVGEVLGVQLDAL